MKAKQDRLKEKRVVSARVAPVFDFVTCPACGHEIPLWTDDGDVARCMFCGRQFFRHETTIH
jgi:ribosomal protein S27E